MTDITTTAEVSAVEAAFNAAADKQVAANDALVDAKEATKAFGASVTEAKGNVKKAKEYLAALPATATDEQKAAGQTSLDSWIAEQAKREQQLADAKVTEKAAKEAFTAADKELKAAKKAKEKADKPAKPAKVKAERVVQNGMAYPADGTISKKLWDIFDAASATKGSPAAITDVFETAKAAGVVDASIRAGYAHWRKFHGITGRVTGADHEAKEKAKADEKAAKAAKKEAEKAEREAKKAAEKAAKDAKAAEAKAAADAAAAAAAAANTAPTE